MASSRELPGQQLVPRAAPFAPLPGTRDVKRDPRPPRPSSRVSHWIESSPLSLVHSLHRDTQELIQGLEDKVYLNRGRDSGGADVSTSSPGIRRQPTIPRPFNIRESKPRPPPIPEPAPPKFRAKPAPSVSDGLTREQVAIEIARDRNRKQQERKYSDPGAGMPKLRVLERVGNLGKVAEEVEERRRSEMPFRPAAPRPVPPVPEATVRMNAAAILREDALYRKKQEEEMRALRAYEAELRDDSSFKRWQKDMIELASAVPRRSSGPEGGNLTHPTHRLAPPCIGCRLTGRVRAARRDREAEAGDGGHGPEGRSGPGGPGRGQQGRGRQDQAGEEEAPVRGIPRTSTPCP